MAPHSISPPSETVDYTQAKQSPAPDLTYEYSAKLQSELQPKSKPRAPLRTIFPSFEIEEHAIDDTPNLKAIVVGAGISGIDAGILFPQKVPGLELVIYEQTSDIVRTHPSELPQKTKTLSRVEHGTPTSTPASNATSQPTSTKAHFRHLSHGRNPTLKEQKLKLTGLRLWKNTT